MDVEHTGSRIFTPEEAQTLLMTGDNFPRGDLQRSAPALAHTVATEPERTRAAVVKALQDEAERLMVRGQTAVAVLLSSRANAIENGED